MPAVVFLVHGMGSHPSGWSDPVAKRLQSLASAVRASVPTDLALTIGDAGSEVLLREIRYDRIFEEHFARNARDTESLLLLGDRQRVRLPVDALFDWLASTDDETRGFFMTHVCDVLLFSLFPLIQKRVVEHVAVQLLKGIVELTPAGGTLQASVLAHSLGTAVTQQALHRLATAPLAGNPAMQPPAFRFQNVAMVANVSRVLERADVFRSIVGPPGRPGIGFYTDRYLNFRHALDPFPMVRPFSPPPSWHPPSYIQPADLAHVLLFNVHDLEHYLVHPAVHLSLINAFWNETVVPKAEIAARVAAYAPAPPGACAAEMIDLHATLTAITARLRSRVSFAEWLQALTEFLMKTRALVKTCRAGGILK